MPLSISMFSPGPYATNCYVVESGGHVLIVDAGFEPEEMIDFVRSLVKSGKTLDALVLTHAHIDHIAGVSAVRAAFPGVPLLIHEAEKDWLGDPKFNLSFYSGLPTTTTPADRLLRHDEKLTLGSASFHVLHTPGHSPGSISLHSKDDAVVFAGDALFFGSIGRTDFPGCSFEELEKSIKTRLYTLPDQTTVHPGHGPATTIGREAKSNPFVKR